MITHKFMIFVYLVLSICLLFLIFFIVFYFVFYLVLVSFMFCIQHFVLAVCFIESAA